jgi:hypothetical protein
MVHNSETCRSYLDSAQWLKNQAKYFRNAAPGRTKCIG